MSRRIAERAQRMAEMFPSIHIIPRSIRAPSPLEDFSFTRYGLSKEAREVAIVAARRCPETARRCYESIARSLIPR